MRFEHGFSMRRTQLSVSVSAAAVAVGGLLLGGCGSSPVRQPAGAPPTPASISVAEPGGDASDTHEAALLRQLMEPWGARNDKDDQVHVPTPDWENWKRVRFWGIEHFAGFRYGAEHHVVSILLVQDAEPGDDSRDCLRRFELDARKRLSAYDVKLGRASERETLWRNIPISVRSVDGSLALGFSRREFSAAWAAYPAYPNACLVYAMAVPWDTRAELARRVRDRWAAEGFQRLHTLTSTRPYRR
ncbi:MAG TPA: hypothetical protein VK524_13330 [Polyangiaceae bacterium]|nr:hypothetical protein [Polyangiaceae bacterium]